MQSNNAREAALQHMASNKLKAAASVLERHITEKDKPPSEKDGTRYAINTMELDSALRKGMETLEYLREVRASTEESHIKAVASTTVNREFREQSSWWLPKQELPQSWFPPPPSTTPNKSSNGPRPPRPVSPKHPPPSTPTTVLRPRPSSGQLRALGVSDEDIATALGELAVNDRTTAETSPRRSTIATQGSSTPRPPRTSLTGTSSRSLAAAATGAAPAASAAAARVTWALQSRGSPSRNGAALYDGGGDEAVPGVGPVGPMQPPPGYPRYTVNMFKQQVSRRQLLKQHQLYGDVDVDQSRRGSGQQADTLVIESDDENGSNGGDRDGLDSLEAESSDIAATGSVNGGSSSGGGGGMALGTGFRALSEEDAHTAFQHVAMNLTSNAPSTTSVSAAVARVTASNEQARGSSTGGRAAFGMVGSVGAGPSAAPFPEPQPSPPRSNSARSRQRQSPLPNADRAQPEAEVSEFISRQSSPLVVAMRSSGAPMRTSSPGVADGGARMGGNMVAGDAALGMSLVGSPAGGLLPSPPPMPSHQQMLESKTTSRLRLGQPPTSLRVALQADSPTFRGSAPSTPSSTRAALSGISGRLRIGTTSASGVPPDSFDGSPVAGGSGGGANTPTGGAAALRARLRVLAVSGPEEEGGRFSSPGTGPPFARSLLAPSSPASHGAPALLESPVHSNHPHMLAARYSERSLLGPGGSTGSLDLPITAGVGASVVRASEAVSPEGAAGAAPASEGPVLKPSLSRTSSHRRLGFRPSLSGEQPTLLDSPPHTQLVPSPPQPAQPAPLPPSPPIQQQSLLVQSLASPAGPESEPLPTLTSAPLEPHNPRPPGLASQTSFRGALTRRPSSAGGRSVPLSGTTNAPAASAPHAATSPLSPDYTPQDPTSDTDLQPNSGSLPSVPASISRSQHPQLKRLPSRSFDSTLPSHFAQDTIFEESDDNDVDGSNAEERMRPPQRGGGSLPPGVQPLLIPVLTASAVLQSPRSGSAGALMPSPRPMSAHSSCAAAGGSANGSPAGASGAPFTRRPPFASVPSAAEQAAAAVAAAVAGEQSVRDMPPCPSIAPSRARRSSMPSGPIEVAAPQNSGPLTSMQSTQSGAPSDGRPWEAPPISPKPSRGVTVSGSVSVSGAPLTPTTLQGRAPAFPTPGTQGRSASVSGTLPVPAPAIRTMSSAGTPVLGRGPRLSVADPLDESPSSPISPAVYGSEYRLSVGPMPTNKKGEMVVVKQTLDI